MNINFDKYKNVHEAFKIKIWPGTAPGSENLSLTEETAERSIDPDIINDRIVTKIIEPDITAYIPPKPNGTALLVIPGSAYQHVLIDKEASELHEWLNPLGITFFVLKYRLPCEGHPGGPVVPLQDAQRAIRLIRHDAVKWGVDRNKIGVMGFSAGGHIASGLAVKHYRQFYERIDRVDDESSRPDFLSLIYPIITMHEPYVSRMGRLYLLGHCPPPEMLDLYSNELHVNGNAPQTFIIHAKDDRAVSPENSMSFYMALKRVNVNVEFHIFYHGGHGFSIRGAKDLPVAKWPVLCGEWMKSIGVL